MADQYPWLKLSTGFITDEKITLIKSYDNGFQMIYIWIAILCEARKNDGFVGINPGTFLMPYSLNVFANLVGVDKKVLENALYVFRETGMIDFFCTGVFFVKNWNKHQYASSTLRMRKYNAKQKKKSKNALPKKIEKDIEKSDNTAVIDVLNALGKHVTFIDTSLLVTNNWLNTNASYIEEILQPKDRRARSPDDVIETINWIFSESTDDFIVKKICGDEIPARSLSKYYGEIIAGKHSVESEQIKNQKLCLESLIKTYIKRFGEHKYKTLQKEWARTVINHHDKENCLNGDEEFYSNPKAEKSFKSLFWAYMRNDMNKELLEVING